MIRSGGQISVGRWYVIIWVLYVVIDGLVEATLPRNSRSRRPDLGRPPGTGYSDPEWRTHRHRPEANISTMPGSELHLYAPGYRSSNNNNNNNNESYDGYPLFRNNHSYDMTGYFRPLIRVFTMDAGCRTFEFVVSFVLVGITCLFGFVGNVLSILTLRRDSIKSVTTFLLSALAVADFAFLVPAVFVIMIPTYCEFYQHCPDRLLRVIPVFEQFGWGVTSTCHTCTVYVTVLVALHRYLWVCRLHIAQRLSGLRRAKIQVGMVPLCALLYNSPRFFEYRVVHYAWNDTVSAAGENTIRKETTKILATVGRDRLFQIGYKNVLFFITMYIIPLAILSMVSVNLIRTLRIRRATLRRIGSTSSTASSGRRDDSITFVLIIIIAAFIICQTPIIVQRLMLAASGSSGALGCGTFYFYFEHVADYLVLLNSSTNFVIYILFSPHFRHTLIVDVLCKRRRTGSNALRMSAIRSRKLPSDERNAMALLEMLPDTNNALVLLALNGHVTGRQRAAGEEPRVNETAENRSLLSPDVNDRSGNGFHSNSSQTTHHELLLMTSQEDLRTKCAEANGKPKPALPEWNPAARDGSAGNKRSENGGEMKVPSIKLEMASSNMELA